MGDDLRVFRSDVDAQRFDERDLFEAVLLGDGGKAIALLVE